MSLADASRLGHYQVVTTLGAGGMGEVYRAHDTRLKRDVALKVLPESLAADPDRLARFEREAEVLASLNHPHIAQIYGVERGGQAGFEMNFLVLELVEGPTLAELIGQSGRGLPIDEVITIARQIADALEAAHERGIVHRDLKPANIKVRPDGTVKVLDFGLAKVFETDGKAQSANGLNNSPTITSPVTGVGVILGTAAYMSPEQARGKPVNKRADVWAFGCVLFELLSGHRPFAGHEITDVIAAIVRAEPEWERLPAGTPMHLRMLLKGCLEKDPARRVGDLAVAKFALAETTLPVGSPSSSPQASAWGRWRMVAVTLLAAIIGAGIATLLPGRAGPTPESSHTARFAIAMTPATQLGRTGSERDIAISRDGTRIAYVSTGGRIILRAFDQLEGTAIPGLENVRGPFFSPDGQWLAFFDTVGFLRRIQVSGGAPIAICSVNAASRGAVWLDDGTIVFATNDAATGLFRVPASGGDATALTTLDRSKEGDHVWPHALPDAHAVTFTVTAAERPLENPQIVMLDLDSGTRSALLQGGSDGHYLSSGHLIYITASNPLFPVIRAVPFDLTRRQTLGPPITVAPAISAANLGANFDVSSSGTLVYSPQTVLGAARTMVWVDRQGRREPIGAPSRSYFYPRISPDGTRVALDTRDQQNDIWIWEFAHQTLTRFTTDPTVDRFPAWTPDGQFLVFTSERDGAPSVYRQPSATTTGAVRITTGQNTQAVMSVTPDGSSVIVRESAPVANLMRVALHGPAELTDLIKTPFVEQNGEVSPDGRWLAYEANDSGEFEIYVRPYPDVDRGRWQVSAGGGTQPLWSRDSRELFFLAPSKAVMSLRVGGGGDWTASTVERLPVINPVCCNAIGGGARTYDIGRDGRFLLFQGVENEGTSNSFALVVVLNWIEELSRLAASK